MKKIVFITGGARSGKSSFALREALKLHGKRAFIATAEATDSEMNERIERHKKDRGDGWATYEEPIEIAEILRDGKRDHRILVIDCLTLWLANVMQSELDAEAEIEHLLSSLEGLSDERVFIVSNEVGMGIVPENELARRFRDLAGRLNQRVAAASDEVYVTFSGIPVKIKG